MARPPSKTGINTTTEREIVWWLAKGLGIEEAARRAGVTSDARLYRLKRTAGFADNLRDALKDRLTIELAPKAIRLLEEIMCDTKMAGRVRVDAAKTILDRAGFTPAAAVAAVAAEADDNMATWTRARLEAFVADGTRQLAREEATDADFEDLPSGEPSGALDGEPNEEPVILQALKHSGQQSAI